MVNVQIVSMKRCHNLSSLQKAVLEKGVVPSLGTTPTLVCAWHAQQLGGESPLQAWQ